MVFGDYGFFGWLLVLKEVWWFGYGFVYLLSVLEEVLR